MGKEIISWATYDEYPAKHDERIECCSKALKTYNEYVLRNVSNGYRIQNQTCLGAYFYQTDLKKEGEKTIFYKCITLEFQKDFIFTITKEENIDRKEVKK